MTGTPTKDELQTVSRANNPKEAAEKVNLGYVYSGATVEVYEISPDPVEVFDVNKSVKVTSEIKTRKWN